MIKAWVNDLNTTNFRIVTSILLTVFAVFVVFIGVTFVHWEPTDKQITVLEGVAIVLLTMMGFDVIQFIGKRQTDTGLAAAKNPNQPVMTNVAPQQDGNTQPAPSSLSPAPKPAIDPELEHTLQIGADRDAQLAAGTLQRREE